MVEAAGEDDDYVEIFPDGTWKCTPESSDVIDRKRKNVFQSSNPAKQQKTKEEPPSTTPFIPEGAEIIELD